MIAFSLHFSQHSSQHPSLHLILHTCLLTFSLHCSLLPVQPVPQSTCNKPALQSIRLGFVSLQPACPDPVRLLLVYSELLTHKQACPGAYMKQERSHLTLSPLKIHAMPILRCSVEYPKLSMAPVAIDTPGFLCCPKSCQTSKSQPHLTTPHQHQARPPVSRSCQPKASPPRSSVGSPCQHLIRSQAAHLLLCTLAVCLSCTLPQPSAVNCQ